MSRHTHSFDWHGLKFSAGFFALCTLLAAIAWMMPQATASMFFQAPPPVALDAAEAAYASTTPERVINQLTIAQAVPKEGKFIAADLVGMQLTLYQDGVATGTYPILTKGRPGTPYETPSGFYRVLTKEKNHFNSGERVNMPYSMEFYGNYFIHGWPTYESGAPVASTYSGGCIRLSTDDAATVYAFADQGTKVFVYDTGAATSAPPLALSPAPLPAVSSASYLVADLDTGDVYAEREAQAARPITTLTKLMTALVANETIMFDRSITIPRGYLGTTTPTADAIPETFIVGDLLYPLLMQSNNNIADALASYYGPKSFVRWMNTTAAALDMASTTYEDPSGISAGNVSTAEDLYRLLHYLAFKKSFVLKITNTRTKSIVSAEGTRFTLSNSTEPLDASAFAGGKIGNLTAAQDTSISVLTLPRDGQERRIAVIVLGSSDQGADASALAGWIASAAETAAQSACAACTLPTYRRVAL